MGGLTSLASTAMQALSVANTVAGAVNSYEEKSGKRDYEQIQKRAALDLQNVQGRASLEKEQIRLDADRIESEKKAALRRLVAKQRAQFGASGISAGDGSSKAYLLGLIDDEEEAARQREALDNLKISLADESVARQQRVNTLTLTQAKEKDKYNKYTAGYGLFGGLGGLLE